MDGRTVKVIRPREYERAGEKGYGEQYVYDLLGVGTDPDSYSGRRCGGRGAYLCDAWGNLTVCEVKREGLTADTVDPDTQLRLMAEAVNQVQGNK